MRDRNFFLVCGSRTSFLMLLTMLYFLLSCVVPRYSINKEEKAFQEKASFATKGYLATTWIIQIIHDKAAIRQLRNDGVYGVEITEMPPYHRDYYLQNQRLLKIKAMQIARSVLPIMSFGDHYGYIEVTFSGKSDYLDIGNREGYQYKVRMPLTDLRETMIVKGISKPAD